MLQAFFLLSTTTKTNHMKKTRLPNIGATNTKKQAAHDIVASGEKCYLNIERKVIDYCEFANRAFRINTQTL